MSLDIDAIGEDPGLLVAPLIVDLGAFGGDQGVIERYAGVVGVVFLLEQEVEAALGEFVLIAVVPRGVLVVALALEKDGT